MRCQEQGLNFAVSLDLSKTKHISRASVELFREARKGR